MQAWALQQVLKRQGHDVVTIDRQADNLGLLYSSARFAYRAAMKMVGKRKIPINLEKQFPYIQKNTRKFIAENIVMSETIDSTEKLKAHFDREVYDAIVVGSDQTWRPLYSPNIENFFLDFLGSKNIKRMAYASSFGVDDWEFTEAQTKRCAELAKQFDAISVRETSGVDLCQKYFGLEAQHVLDPTLLLERKNYEDIYRDKDIPKRGGVYTYILDRAGWKDQVVDVVKNALSKPEYTNQPKASLARPSSGEVEDYKMPAVEAWIRGFSEADFVVTDSFHGTIFSIIFNKPFISLINSQRGASRFYSILGELGLMSRLISEFKESNVRELVEESINYEHVNCKLLELREESMSFLMKALSE